MRYLGIIIILIGISLWGAATLLFLREAKDPQGTTMGGDMLFNTLWLLGSVLLALGFGFLKLFYWGWCIPIAILAYLLSFLLRFKLMR